MVSGARDLVDEQVAEHPRAGHHHVDTRAAWLLGAGIQDLESSVSRHAGGLRLSGLGAGIQDSGFKVRTLLCVGRPGLVERFGVRGWDSGFSTQFSVEFSFGTEV